jgi:hypothetical protein
VKYILLILILLTLYAVFKAFKANGGLAREKKIEPSPNIQPKNNYHAVSVVPCEKSCNAASRASKETFLSTDLPRLPLASCDKILDCQCRFIHYDDRRQNEDRRSGSIVLQNTFAGKENRKQQKRDRRKSN